MSKGSWSQWASLGGELAPGTSPAISSRGRDRLDVFVTGTDQHLWRNYWEGPKWSGWKDHGGLLGSSPSAVSWGMDRDRIDIFAQGKDVSAGYSFNLCWHMGWNGKEWFDWKNEGLPLSFGEMAPTPAITSWGLMNLHMFISGGKLYFEDPEEEQESTAGRIAAAVLSFGLTELGRAIGSDPNIKVAPLPKSTHVLAAPAPLWHSSWNGTGWSAVENLGGELTSSPAAVSWGPNRIDVFARSKNSYLLHQYWTGSAWSGWKIIKNLKFFGNPAVVSLGPNLLDVFVTGNNNHLMHMTWNGSNWSSWEDLGGELTSSPAAVAWDSDRIDVVACGTDGHIYHTYLRKGVSNVVIHEIIGGAHLSAGSGKSQ
jgi:hypothetical protein